MSQKFGQTSALKSSLQCGLKNVLISLRFFWAKLPKKFVGRFQTCGNEESALNRPELTVLPFVIIF